MPSSGATASVTCCMARTMCLNHDMIGLVALPLPLAVLGQCPSRRHCALCSSTVESTISANWLVWTSPSCVRMSCLRDLGHRLGSLSCWRTLRHAVGCMHRDNGGSGCLRCALHRLSGSVTSSESVSGRLYGSPGFCLDGTQSCQMHMR